MQVNPGNAMSPDSQDQNSLEELAALIERATRDGRLSRKEWEDIRAKVREDGRITPQELDLTNQLMEQVNQGVIILED
jgi:uncharacterized membrane protein YebE (DUF533 family)